MSGTIIKTNDPHLEKLSRELIKSGIIQTAKPDTCWLDCSRCPYGYPEGTFVKRPTACFMGDGGCEKLKDHKSDIIQFSKILIDEESNPKLQKVFDKHGVTLSSEITMLADGDENYKISELEKTILATAANIIEREEKNDNRAPIDNKIIRRKDFEV